MRIKNFLSLSLALILAGCSAAVNPYSSEFSCPQAEKGKCVSIPQAYVESFNKTDNTTKILESYFPSLEEDRTKVERGLTKTEAEYVDALFNKVTKVLKDPQTPILTVPKVVRILILPYRDKDGKTLYFSRYVFTVTKEPQWVFENLLTGMENEEK